MTTAAVPPHCPRCGGPLYPDVPDRWGQIDHTCLYCGEVEYDRTPPRWPTWRGQGRAGRPKQEQAL